MEGWKDGRMEGWKGGRMVNKWIDDWLHDRVRTRDHVQSFYLFNRLTDIILKQKPGES